MLSTAADIKVISFILLKLDNGKFEAGQRSLREILYIAEFRFIFYFNSPESLSGLYVFMFC